MLKQFHAHIALMMLAAIAVLYPHLTQAQDRSGSLQGVVKNSSGTPVSGAFVKMKNPERRLMFMVITQAGGRYAVSNLPIGK
jgi:Carboxypeptidase regulatory-like domain